VAQGDTVATLEVLPWRLRVANACISYATYVGQFFYPTGLAVFYPHLRVGLPMWKAAAALMVLVLVSAAVAIYWRKRPYLLVGWLWFLGMLVPVIGLVQVGIHARADRYTYLPQIGLCISLAWLASSFLGRNPRRSGGSFRCPSWLTSVVSAMLLASVTGGAWRQTVFWRDDETVWNRALACTSANALAHNNLATFRAHQGRMDEAIDHYRRALEIRPDLAEAHNNLGALLLMRGQVDQSIAECRRALEIRPQYPSAHLNLGKALDARGFPNDAISHYRKALEIQPNFAAAHNNLGNILTARGSFDEAIAHCRKALEIAPERAPTHFILATALTGRGEIDEAIAEYKTGLTLKPDDVPAVKNLRLIVAERERIRKQLADERDRLVGRPNDIGLLNDLAWCLATNPSASTRNGAEAVVLAQRAAKLSYEREPAVLGTLAAAYAEARRFPEAIETARKALELTTAQNNTILAESIKKAIRIYEAGGAFRDTSRFRVDQ
jgi:tetratricopeptide (TPR) repeat protein